MTPRAAGNRRRNWPKIRIWGVMALCILMSVSWTLYAAFWGDPADGGRGGAVAVALTFAMLFLDRGTAKNLLEVEIAPKKSATAPTEDETLAAYLDGQAGQRARLEVEQTKCLSKNARANKNLLAITLQESLDV